MHLIHESDETSKQETWIEFSRSRTTTIAKFAIFLYVT